MSTGRSKKTLERLRPAAFLLTTLFAAALLAYGIFRGEVGEVMFNAAML